jgi:HlyD family secretion protein
VTLKRYEYCSDRRDRWGRKCPGLKPVSNGVVVGVAEHRSLEIGVGFMRRTGAIVVVVVAVLAALGVGAWFFRFRGDKAPVLRTVPVKRGDLVATISATGTVEPEAAVDVGTQVAGVIIAFGKDRRGKEINWGSEVEAGTVLARIDDSLYAAAVKTTEAQVKQGEANVQASEANVLQTKAKLLQATQDWGRARKLGPSDALAQSTYDQYQTNYEVARANLAAAEAAVEQTKAALAQAKAGLVTARINLDYCTIKSPVKGVVIDRRVNIGQTVVSSLSAPSLFLIANDLKRIQVLVSVNEADVGSISAGEPVTFTVDAFPGRVFHGRVGQVRLNATMTQNVVTYTIEVDTDNSDGTLLPYLTANAQFEIGRRKDVLLVPNAALRFSPKPERIAPDARHGSRGGRRGGGIEPKGEGGTIWIEEGKFVRPLFVEAGLTDGAFTEVGGPRLAEGLPVVVGEGVQEAGNAPSADRNPFTPQAPFHNNRQSQNGSNQNGSDQGGSNQEQEGQRQHPSARTGR